jgi:uncharacterized protein (TIGR03085 family)
VAPFFADFSVWHVDGMTAASRERAALVNTMRAVGPDGPTLCGDWTTRDLAAHLVLRERRLDAAPGILIPALGGYTARKQQRLADSTDWSDLLELVASGPPLYSPMKLLDPLVNTTEMFVHHEDLRRAVPGWQPRPLSGDTVAALRRPIPMLARVALGGVPARLTLRTPEDDTLATVGSGPAVTITADPGELLMFVFGRDEARAEFDGDDEAVAAVRSAKRGL